MAAKTNHQTISGSDKFDVDHTFIIETLMESQSKVHCLKIASRVLQVVFGFDANPKVCNCFT